MRRPDRRHEGSPAVTRRRDGRGSGASRMATGPPGTSRISAIEGLPSPAHPTIARPRQQELTTVNCAPNRSDEAPNASRGSGPTAADSDRSSGGGSVLSPLLGLSAGAGSDGCYKNASQTVRSPCRDRKSAGLTLRRRRSLSGSLRDRCSQIALHLPTGRQAERDGPWVCEWCSQSLTGRRQDEGCCLPAGT